MTDRVAVVTQIDEWIRKNAVNFLPPISNCFLHKDGQLTVMFVGGPNERKDYHIQEGEEFFYQLRGNALLRLVVQGRHRDVLIKEGEVFLLPPRIPHSPQRFENTMGLVLERKRRPHEIDVLRFYVNSEEGPLNEILYQTTFHWDNANVAMTKSIQEFLETEQCKTGRPIAGQIFETSFEVNTSSDVSKPFSLRTWMSLNERRIDHLGKLELFDTKIYKHKIYVFGCGHNQLYDDRAQIWLLQLDGESKISTSCLKKKSLKKHDSLILPIGDVCEIWQEKGSFLLSCCQQP